MIYLRQPKCPLAQRLCMRTLCSSNPLKLLVALIARSLYASPLRSCTTTRVHTHKNTYAATSMLSIYSTPSPHCAQTLPLHDRWHVLKILSNTHAFRRTESHFFSWDSDKLPVLSQFVLWLKLGFVEEIPSDKHQHAGVCSEILAFSCCVQRKRQKELQALHCQDETLSLSRPIADAIGGCKAHHRSTIPHWLHAS